MKCEAVTTERRQRHDTPPDKVLLTTMVQNKTTVRSIAKSLNTTIATTRWWLKKYDLRTLHPPLFLVKTHHCSQCGESDPSKFYDGRKRTCRKCFLANDRDISKAKKLRAIAHMGGACCKCGYSKCHGALEFHHVDRADKEDWTAIRNWGWERIAELAKCLLVCANCHREIHAAEDKWDEAS